MEKVIDATNYLKECIEQDKLSEWNQWCKEQVSTNNHSLEITDIPLDDLIFKHEKAPEFSKVKVIRFEKVRFKNVTFWRTNFLCSALFIDCEFLTKVNFNHSKFNDGVTFSQCIFSEDFALGFSTFENDANFIECEFKKNVSFSRVQFKKQCVFNRSVFEKDVIFEATEFQSNSRFDEVTFKGVADFGAAKFNGDAIFRSFEKEENKTGFHSEANFVFTSFFGRVEFNNWLCAEMVFTRADFDKEAIFSQVDLSNAKFHFVDLNKNIYFYNVKWKKNKKRYCFTEESDDQDPLLGAYESDFGVKQALKHYSELVAYYDKMRDVRVSEDFFFAEMSLREEQSGTLEKLLYSIYRLSSKYGTSISRAIYILIFLVFMFAPILLFLSQEPTLKIAMSSYYENYWLYLKKSLQAVMVHKSYYEGLSLHGFFVSAFIQIMLLGQLALSILAIRRGLRRGSPSA